MTTELETKTLLTVTVISILITGMLITSNPFLADVKKVFADDDVVTESSAAASNDVTIADTPGHSTFPTPIQRGTTTDLTLEAIFGSAPHHGNQVRVWDPGLADEQPVAGLGCTNFGTDTAGPGEKWLLMADSEPNGSFETIVQYDLPEVGDSITLTGFGSGANIFVIASNFDSLGTDPDLVPSISSGANFAWVDDLGVANTDDTSVIGRYKFGSCGTEGINQAFRGEVTFDVVASCTTLTKEADPTSGPWPLTVTYNYNETNCGEEGDSPLTLVTITDIGEDADNDGILDGSEDMNSNGVLDPGCSPVVDVDVAPADGFNDGDTDTDDNLDPGETWAFECTAVINPVGMFNNTAFSEGTICLDPDCLDLDGIHTGDPACEPQIGMLCDPNERNSTKVTVLRQTPQVKTQSQPSTSNLTPGAAVTDKATVNSVPPSLVPAPTGTVKFFLCGPGLANPATAAGCPLGTGTMIGGPVALAGIPPMATSAAVSGATTTPDGKYCWRAEYSGDTNYTTANHTNSLISNNGGECFNVGGKGTIKIIKDTVPNGPQDFKFTHNIPSNPVVSNPFFLDDDSNPTLPNMRTFLEVPAGSYTVTEMTVPAIPLLSIICVDPDGGSGRSGNSADIDLDAGETVTCTFVNGVLEAPCENGQLPSQPEDTISMTTIRSNNIVKTIHAEKQIFNCELPQGDIPVIADVTIIAEIFQDINTKTVIGKQVEVVTCIKMNATGAILECNLSIPSQDRIPVANCSESPLEHPQEMNTIRKGATAKTIETQKEVFICTFADGTDPPESTNPNDKKVDLVLFTEIYQNLNTLTSEDPQILSMKCVIKIDNVKVESCRFTNHPL